MPELYVFSVWRPACAALSPLWRKNFPELAQKMLQGLRNERKETVRLQASHDVVCIPGAHGFRDPGAQLGEEGVCLTKARPRG